MKNIDRTKKYTLQKMSLSVSKFPFYKETSQTGLDFTFNLPLKRNYLQIQSHSDILGVRTLTFEFKGDTIQPLTIPKVIEIRVSKIFVHPCS